MEKFRFKKRFGQNFLKSSFFPSRIAQSLSLNEDDTVVEIGPGRGALTSQIYGKVKRLIIIEIDVELIEFLKNTFPETEIVNEDVMRFDPKSHGLTELGYKLTGSLPYNISKRIISKFLTEKVRPSVMSVLIQKEVADDYASTSPKAAFLGNYSRIYSDVELISKVPKEEFHPTPKVDGSILKFELKGNVENDSENLARFIKTGYSSPRKKLLSNLSNSYKIEKELLKVIFNKLNLSENFRPAELKFEEWSKLYQSLKKQKPGSLK